MTNDRTVDIDGTEVFHRESGDPDGVVLPLPKAELHLSDVVFSP